jgi:glycosyltransferase involved in cell wall biosynthesis
MQDARNESDPNADLFVSNIDFRELNRHKSPGAALKVLSRSVYSREARRKFSLLLDRFKPDIVHLQNIHGHITPSVILEAKKRGLPVVWTLHDYKLICPNTHFLIDRTAEICEACGRGSYYQCVLKRCKKGSLLASGMAAMEAYAHRLMHVREQVDAFLAPSTFLREKLIQHGFSGEVVHHLPLFLPEAQFDGDSRDGGGYILYLGKLDPIKGIMPLLEACRLAPEVNVVIAGSVEEPLSSRLPDMLPENARFVGVMRDEALRQLLKGCLAVVLPSLSYENQPFAILEAFAGSKPVIASDLGGMRELVKHEERGLLVQSGDAEGLRQAMLWLESHPLETLQMGRAAYAYACQQHAPEAHYRRLLGTYQSALNAR